MKIDRKLFIKWTEGYLFDRNAKGEVYVLDGPNGELCEKAQAELDKGKTLLLTVNGKVVTKVTKTKKGYKEELI